MCCEGALFRRHAGCRGEQGADNYESYLNHVDELGGREPCSPSKVGFTITIRFFLALKNLCVDVCFSPSKTNDVIDNLPR